MQRDRHPSLPRPRPGLRAAAHPPEIVLVGTRSRRLEAVAASLRSLEAATRRVDRARMPDAPWERCLAVGIVEGSRASRTLEKVLDHCPDRWTPVFVVVGENTSPEELSDLHRADVAAVFQWPTECLRFPDVVARLIGAQHVRGQPTSSDAAIARAIRARLQPEEEPGEEVVISVHDRIASVFGMTETLWRRNQIVEMLPRIPRVRHVVEAEDLRVAAWPVSDEELAGTLREVIRAISEDVFATVAVSVHHGFVTLAGTTSDRVVFPRILDITSRIRGVRGIEDLTTVSTRHQERERRRAWAIQQGVRRWCGAEKVDIAVFGHTGVLSGAVRTPRERADLERLVVRHPAIHSVINQLKVAYPAERRPEKRCNAST